MVDIAAEAFRSRNFGLATEIYERIIRDKGPAYHLLIQLGSCLALSGHISEAFTAFIKAYRLCGKNVQESPKELAHLIQSLVKLTREIMLTVADGRPNLIAHAKEVLAKEPFLCGYCLELILEPTTIYCGHTFCRKCVEKHNVNTCVCCGKNPSVSVGFKPNVLLASAMSKLFPNAKHLARLKNDANAKSVQEKYEDAIELYTRILKVCKY